MMIQAQGRLTYYQPKRARAEPKTSDLTAQHPPSAAHTVQQLSYSAPSVWRELGSLAAKIAMIAVSSILIFTFFYGFHRSTDFGMIPMIKDGDLLLFYRLDRDYAIGDLLLLEFQGQRQVRRVVANAGDTVDITEDGLIINGGLQHEPYIFQETWRYTNGVPFPLTVGEGQVFVLGDARENVTDSRVYGPVNTRDTLGKVITVIRRRGL